VSAEGREHRWTDGEAVIDVLIPTHLGRSQTVTGCNGQHHLRRHGSQQALDRSELVTVAVGDSTGRVRRPNLVGALNIKGQRSARRQETPNATRST